MESAPIPFAALLENTLDDAHGVHAHHGLAGLDRALARPASLLSIMRNIVCASKGPERALQRPDATAIGISWTRIVG